MTVPELPAVHHITVDGRGYLATRKGEIFDRVGSDDYWHPHHCATDHGVVIPAGPVEDLVQLPEVGHLVRDQLCWREDGRSTGISAAITADKARLHAKIHMAHTAQFLAVARAIDAEQAKPLTARERLLAKLEGVDDVSEGLAAYIAVTVADLRAALGEQP